MRNRSIGKRVVAVSVKIVSGCINRPESNFEERLFNFKLSCLEVGIVPRNPKESFLCLSNVSPAITAPHVAPTNISAFNTSSTSIHVTWQPISIAGLRGILREYRVYFTEQQTYFVRSLRNVTVNSATLETELLGLYKFTNYSVYIVARTNKNGVSSERVRVSTDEDSK